MDSLETIIVDLIMPNNKDSKYREQKLLELKRKLDNSTNKIQNFYLLGVIRKSRLKKNQ